MFRWEGLRDSYPKRQNHSTLLVFSTTNDGCSFLSLSVFLPQSHTGWALEMILVRPRNVCNESKMRKPAVKRQGLDSS